MDDFEEKLNSILASPETMGQIMALADSISGPPEQSPSGASPSGPAPSGADSSGPQVSVPTPSASANPLAMLQSLDPAMLKSIVSLFQEYNRSDDEKTALLHALQPFLREERQSKVDKAIRITRLSRVIRAAFQMFRENGHV